MVEHIKEAGKINLANQQTDRRHDDAFHERGDDLAKRCANNQGYC
jgi:hypothetical protein